MLEVVGLTVAYGRRPAISDVSLRVGDHEAVAVLGPNGAGKTTLLRAISGMIPTVAGTIALSEVELSKRLPESTARAGVTHVAEGRRLFRNMTCRENLLLGGFTRAPAAVAADLDRMLEVFPELQPKMSAPAGSLSGGQQQMLVIARGLMSRPKLLLLDEPTIGLSPLIVQRLLDVLTSSAREFFGSLLLVEQDLSLAVAVASRVYVLRNGRIVHEGPAAAVRTETLVAEYFGAA